MVKKCVVKLIVTSLVASHLIPKRIGTEGAQDIAKRFSGEQTVIGIHRYDPRIGILLSTPLNSLVEN